MSGQLIELVTLVVLVILLDGFVWGVHSLH